MRKRFPPILLSLASAFLGVVLQAFFARRRALILEPPEGGPEEFGDPDAPGLNFVVIGDSTSVGVGATSLRSTYPWLLATHLAGRYRVRLTVVGRSGARMADAATEFVPKAAALRPDLVLIGIGANDVTHLTPLPRFERWMSKVIESLREADTELLVALGPRFDAPALPQPLRTLARARARAINRTIRKIAVVHGVTVLDLPGGVGSAFARDRSLYCDDGFHPSDRGYVLWAEAMKDDVESAARVAAAKPASAARSRGS